MSSTNTAKLAHINIGLDKIPKERALMVMWPTVTQALKIKSVKKKNLPQEKVRGQVSLLKFLKYLGCFVALAVL